MGKHKKSRDHVVSGGKRRASRMMRNIKRLGMKINRWKRYQEEIKKGEKKGNILRWNTAGLEKHSELLESLL